MATALSVVPPAGVDTYRQSTDAAHICREIVIATASKIGGRQFVAVEGWQAIAVAHGCVASAIDVHRVSDEGCEGFAATGVLRRMSDGVEIGRAEGFVGDDEKTWGKRDVYARRAMAQTRAISRVCRSAFAHVVVMMKADLSTTPAEEMLAVNDVPAASPPPQPAKRERMEGPCSTVAELRERCRGIQSDIEGADDAEALEAVIDANLDVFAQLRRYKPDWWSNEDYGLSPLIERQRAYFANAGEEGTALDPADPEVDAVALEFPGRSESFLMFVAGIRACETDAAVSAYATKHKDAAKSLDDIEQDLLKDVAARHRADLKQRGISTAG